MPALPQLLDRSFLAAYNHPARSHRPGVPSGATWLYVFREEMGTTEMLPTTYCATHDRLEPFVELETIMVPDEAALEQAMNSSRQVKVQLGCGETKNVILRRPIMPETAYD